MPDRQLDVHVIKEQIAAQGDKVRALKADPSLPAEEALKRTLQEEIEKLKSLKRLLPPDALQEPGKNKKRKREKLRDGC